MITVIATINLKPDCRDACLKRLLALVPTVLAEPGCMKYQPLVDTPCDLDRVERDDEQITLLEHWSTTDALSDHLNSKHVKAYQQDAEQWVLSVSLRVLQTP